MLRLYITTLNMRSSPSINMLRNKIPAERLNQIPRRPELLQHRLYGTRCRSWIGKIAMDHYCFTGKYWTSLLRVVANRNNKIKILGKILVNYVRRMSGNIYAVFHHDSNRGWVHTVRLNPRTPNDCLVSGKVAQISLGHLAPTAVTCT